MTAARSAPLGRGTGFERGVLTLVGVLALLAGIGGLAVGSGALGVFRSQRPVLDPMFAQWAQATPLVWLPVAIVGGLVLLVLGGWWVRRALRPEARPDVRLGNGEGGELTITAGALTEAVRRDAQEVTGVTKTRVRTVGSPRDPGLRLSLSLEEGTDVRQVWAELDDRVLSRARRALGREALRTSIRLHLDRAPGRRVR
ncbi:alkaline shock response membrane anchor protein AmaP [Saccharopolyspora sp. HNM0983]|uniref:Alkaline shock response membrane anchor protein AmaP n=1 Tax=Saccharopolyspora montiporae TaxID=2781240 RepID=A0A929B894_9PSEU|nr:alkaline shock response membrane anchor protein AmaP [Saccharopolyspora sp. HNM0983]MBE9373023.1 alkaline shock response membrane anchor protein AmaP [Saccharopolyspora sp. HNM0983]